MSQCRVCGDETEVVVNIQFQATPVCDPCCLAITKQTVAAWKLIEESVGEKEETGIRSRKDGWG